MLLIIVICISKLLVVYDVCMVMTRPKLKININIYTTIHRSIQCCSHTWRHCGLLSFFFNGTNFVVSLKHILTVPQTIYYYFCTHQHIAVKTNQCSISRMAEAILPNLRMFSIYCLINWWDACIGLSRITSSDSGLLLHME